MPNLTIYPRHLCQNKNDLLTLNKSGSIQIWGIAAIREDHIKAVIFQHVEFEGTISDIHMRFYNYTSLAEMNRIVAHKVIHDNYQLVIENREKFFNEKLRGKIEKYLMWNKLKQ